MKHDPAPIRPTPHRAHARHWTAERDQLIRDLWWQGRTDQQISQHPLMKLAGISKNAVVGRRIRLRAVRNPDFDYATNLRREFPPIAARLPKTRAANRRRGPKPGSVNKVLRMADPALAARPENDPVQPKGIFEIGPGECRFPVAGAEEHTLFCARKAVTVMVPDVNRSWCAGHARLVFNPRGD